MRSRTWWGAVALLAVPVLALPAAATTPGPAPVDLGGTPVEGGSLGAPTDLTVGLWADTLSGPGVDSTVRWFSYRRTMADSTVLLGVAATSTEDFGDTAEITVLAGEEECGRSTAPQGSTAPHRPLGAFLAIGIDEDGDRSACVTSTELLIGVGRGSAEATSDLPFVLRVVEEAPVLGERGPEPPDSVAVEPPRPGALTARPGGVSFDDAPEVGSGTWGEDVPQGEIRFWRVRLGWGQSLAVRVDVPAQDDRAAEAIGGFSPGVELVFFDPLRNAFNDLVEDADNEGTYASSEVTLMFDGAPPVAFTNRDAQVDTTVPGDYWIGVAVAPANEAQPPGPPVEVPIEVTLEVSGDEGDGPGFPQSVTGPGGTPEPDGYAADTPYLVAAGQFAADISSSPSASAADGTDSTRRTAGLVLGGVSLLAFAAGAVLLRRRSRALSPAAAR